MLFRSPVAANRTYNLVSDESTTIAQIAELVRELVAPVPIEDVGARTADFGGVEVSGERARRELGWTARTPFREGVRRYVEWRRDEEAPATVRARPRRSPSVPAARTLLPSLFWLAAAAMLFAYLAAVHSIGLSGRESGTVGLTSVISIFAFLAFELQTGRGEERQIAMAIGSVVLSLFAFAAMVPWSREALDFAEPTAAVIALSVTGAGLGCALVAMGLGLTRERSGPAALDSAVGA